MTPKERQNDPEQRERMTIGVDAVILPPPEITRLSISMSRQLRETSPVILNSKNYLPHITLAMGYVDNVPRTVKKMKRVFEEVGSFTAVVEDVFRSPQDFNGHYFWHLVIGKNPALQELHERLVEILPFVDKENPSEQMFYKQPDEEIVPAVFTYVSGFREKNSKEHFWPHITLGAGSEESLAKPKNLPKEFTVDKIHLCQLGNFCTCRKILS